MRAPSTASVHCSNVHACGYNGWLGVTALLVDGLAFGASLCARVDNRAPLIAVFFMDTFMLPVFVLGLLYFGIALK